jgi:glycosyltransferase involved in cell wall biosynthesis
LEFGHQCSRGETLLRVLQVAHYYGSPGGIERVVHQFCQALKDVYDVEVLVCNTGPRTTQTTEDGIPVTRVGRVAHLNRMSLCPTFPMWLRMKKPDLVHLHMINPLAEFSFLLSNLRCKTIATYHMDVSRQRFLSALYSPVQQKFLDRVSLITEKKVRILPFGLSSRALPESEEATRLKETLFRTIPGRVVLFVGRLTHYKGLEILLEAMRDVDATCLVVGGGYLRNQLQRRIDDLSLHEKVRLVGEIPDSELVAYHDRADAFVLPSVNRTESYGLAQLEAMSRSTPVICTEVGTGTSFVNQDGETGLVVPPGDVDSLSRAIRRVLEDDALRDRLAQGALNRCRTLFSERTMAESLRQLYEEVLG